MDWKKGNICTVAITIWLCLTVVHGQDVVIKNLKLFVDGTEFFVKAICYSPAPLGYLETPGTGLCSPRPVYPVGGEGQQPQVQQQGCYLRDFFDGTHFQPIWQRDLPELQALGVNTIRFYHTNPVTSQAVKANPALFPDQTLGANHIPFLDMVQQYGLKVIYPLFDDKTAILTLPRAQMEKYLMWGIDEVGNHPAILMFAFGNEMGVAQDDTFRATVNHYLEFIKNYTRTKWNREVPVTLGEVDLPSAYNMLAVDLKVDLLMTNAGYRGPTFSDLWSGWANGIFWGWKKLSCMTGKPLLIGEIGQHSTDGWYNDPTWFPAVWDDLIAHIDDGAIGGALFEWSDEAWKAANQQTMGVVSYSVAETAQGKSTDPNVLIADALTRKVGTGAYDFNIVAETFAKDPFQQLGRQPYTLDTAPDMCIGVTWPTDNPIPPTSGPSGPSTPGSTSDGGSQTPLPPAALAYNFDNLMNGTTTIADKSGNKLDGTIGGNVTLVPGKFGKAVHMQRIINEVETGDQYIDTGLVHNATSFSVAAWIKIADQFADHHMKIASCKGATWNDQNGWELEYHPATSTFSLIGAGDSVAQAFKSIDTKWHHVAVVVNGPVVKIYIDGKDETKKNAIYPLLGCANSLLVGSNIKEPLSGGTFSGDIDEFLLFDAPIGAANVRSLMARPWGTTPSVTSLTGTNDPLQTENDVVEDGGSQLVLFAGTVVACLLLARLFN